MGKIQSVERALKILEILAEYPDGVGVTEFSLKLNVAKSTAHRLLNTLLSQHYVAKDERTDNYILGTQILFIANQALENMSIVEIAKAEINKLSDLTNETVHLCLFDKDEVVYIDKVESNQTIRMYSRVGKRSLMHCTGVGKAILAFLKKEEVKEILSRKGMPEFTKKTITTLDEMWQELEKISKDGFALDDIEHEEGIRCVAAPIFDHNKKPIAAISISAPSTRVSFEKATNELSKLVKQSAAAISYDLGSKR
ncbi:IclR family transcriptional regulator [Pseudogracilibacillus sp. SE30717A]|uniref:IclR family transcriptional regulator n=1 Tax=Pseudogracilibacillus sp. SE30717A TaxID=3098293 RepID=UPI00300E4693